MRTRGQERHGKSCGGRAGPSHVRAGLRGAPCLGGSGGARSEGARVGFGKTAESEHLPVNSTDGILKGGERLLQGSEILQRIHPWHWDKRAVTKGVFSEPLLPWLCTGNFSLSSPGLCRKRNSVLSGLFNQNSSAVASASGTVYIEGCSSEPQTFVLSPPIPKKPSLQQCMAYFR